MPATILGTKVGDKVNFANIGHVGILNAIEPYLLSVSLSKTHLSNRGIADHRGFSINIMSQVQIEELDFAGTTTGHKTDKSRLFDTFTGELKTVPIIRDCPLSMECRLFDTYVTATTNIYIGEVVATYADEAVLTNGKIDLQKVRPVLFDMNGLQYWSIGEPLGKCWK